MTALRVGIRWLAVIGGMAIALIDGCVAASHHRAGDMDQAAVWAGLATLFIGAALRELSDLIHKSHKGE